MVDSVEAGFDFVVGSQEAAVGAVEVVDIIAFQEFGRVPQMHTAVRGFFSSLLAFMNTSLNSLA